MDLSDYERRKFELAEILRGAAALRATRGGHDEPIQELFARLAEDRFNLVVVGRFSRGKSSLMNAILGMDKLPTGIIPLTSVITAVGYGSNECVELTYEGSFLRREIKLEDLAQFVTQEGNPGNIRQVKLAEVQLPAEILRRGFYFIDTPGLGSAIAENTRTTESFLPAADAFLLVTGYEGPLSDEEFRFLRETAPSARRIFIAINKHDIVPPPERDQALAYVRGQLETLFGEGVPKVFSTSASEGLKAKQARDDERLRESGIAELEEELLRFLVSDKSTEFLLRMCDRVAALLNELSSTSEASRLVSRLVAVRAEIGNKGDGEQNTRTAVGGLAPARSEKAGACEICRAVESACFDFLAGFQYELTVSAEQQRELAQSGGLCRLHTWWYHNLASPQGMSVGYPGLLERWAEQLAHMAREEGERGPSRAADTIQQRLPTRETCPVCKVCDEVEAAAVATTAARLDDAGGGAVDHLSAICLQHLPALLRTLKKDEVARKLLLRQAGLLERVAEDMRRYALKVDALRRGLASRAEEGAAGRAMPLLAGLRNMSFLKRME